MAVSYRSGIILPDTARYSALGEQARSNRLAQAVDRQRLQMQQQQMQRKEREALEQARRYGQKEARDAATGLARLYQTTAGIEDMGARNAAFARGMSHLRSMYPARNGVDPFDDVSDVWEQTEHDALMPYFAATTSTKPTSLMQNLQAAGLQPGTPEFQEAMLRAVERPSTQITNIPAPPAGYQYVDPTDPGAGLTIVAGGPKDPSVVGPEEARASRTRARQLASGIRDARRTVQLIQESGSELSGPVADEMTLARGNIMAAIAAAREQGVIQEGEARRMEAEFPDPTSVGSVFRSRDRLVKAHQNVLDRLEQAYADLPESAQVATLDTQPGTFTEDEIRNMPTAFTPDEVEALSPGTFYINADGEIAERGGG